MKLVVLGDLHLGGGYSLGKIDSHSQLNTRLIDHSNTFDFVVDYLVEHGIRHLAITGDIYQDRRPEASQTAIFSDKLARLTELGIHTHIVAGNHDIVRAHKATTIDKFKLLRLPMVHIYNDIESYCCPDGINMVFLPYRTRQMLQCWSNEDAVLFLQKRFAHELQQMDNDNPVILIGHLTLQDARSHGTQLEEHAVFDIIMPLSSFEGFDAVIMGHIHQFQVLSDGPLIAHIGSMERTDFGESKQPKMFAVLDSDRDNLSWEFVQLPVKPLCDLVIDKSSEGPDGIMESIKQYIQSYDAKYPLVNSIIRVEVTVNESAAHAVDTAEIFKFLRDNMSVSSCVGVHAVAISKRQLRDSTITEKADPKSALNKWIELNVDNKDMKEEMRKAGYKIIDGKRTK